MDVFTTLCGQGWFASLVAGDVATAVAGLGGDVSLRDHLRQELAGRGLTGSMGRSPIAPDHTVSRVMFAAPDTPPRAGLTSPVYSRSTNRARLNAALASWSITSRQASPPGWGPAASRWRRTRRCWAASGPAGNRPPTGASPLTWPPQWAVCSRVLTVSQGSWRDCQTCAADYRPWGSRFASCRGIFVPRRRTSGTRVTSSSG